MEKHFKRTLITTALPYANGPVHIGHLAGVYVPADIYARYLRLKGEEVLMIGGSDEHGVPITLRAKKEGITPQDVVDRYHGIIKKSFEEFGISFDIYSRTTSATHRQVASDFFRTLYDKGEFIEKTSEQYYDEEAKQFLADRYITGTCPHCGNEKAVCSVGIRIERPLGEQAEISVVRQESRHVLPVFRRQNRAGRIDHPPANAQQFRRAIKNRRLNCGQSRALPGIFAAQFGFLSDHPEARARHIAQHAVKTSLRARHRLPCIARQ